MKTTVEIPDSLFREVKRYAAAHDLTLKEVLEAGLRAVVKGGSARRFRLRKCAFKGEGMVADYSWPEIRAIVYEGRGGDRN